MEHIRLMIIQAEKHSLQVEVIWSYGNSRNAGASVEEATNYALADWDIL